MILFLLAGCSHSKLKELEDVLFDQKEVFVMIEENEMLEEWKISKSDYTDHIAVKTLVVLDQKKIYVFENADDALKRQAGLLGYYKSEIQNYTIFMSHENLQILTQIEDILNK